MSKDNDGKVISLDSRRPHQVKWMECNKCNHETVTIHPVGTNESTLECPKCGQADSRTWEIEENRHIKVVSEEEEE